MPLVFCESVGHQGLAVARCRTMTRRESGSRRIKAAHMPEHKRAILREMPLAELGAAYRKEDCHRVPPVPQESKKNGMNSPIGTW